MRIFMSAIEDVRYREVLLYCIGYVPKYILSTINAFLINMTSLIYNQGKKLMDKRKL